MNATDLKKIDDTAQYRVELKTRLELFGQVFHPGHHVTLRGDVIKSHAESIARAEKVEA